MLDPHLWHAAVLLTDSASSLGEIKATYEKLQTRDGPEWKVLRALGKAILITDEVDRPERLRAIDPSLMEKDLAFFDARWAAYETRCGVLKDWIRHGIEVVSALEEAHGAAQLKHAALFAQERHAGQLYGDEPYSVHLAWVSRVLRRYGITDWVMHAAAYLHDTVEDTETTVAEIENRFGPEVAKLVHALTNEKGENRAERHRKTYPKIRAAGVAAVNLKLADRTANVEACRQGKGKKKAGLLDMYRKEHEAFKAALLPLGDMRMWAGLEELLK